MPFPKLPRPLNSFLQEYLMGRNLTEHTLRNLPDGIEIVLFSRWAV